MVKAFLKEKPVIGIYDAKFDIVERRVVFERLGAELQ